MGTPVLAEQDKMTPISSVQTLDEFEKESSKSMLSARLADLSSIYIQRSRNDSSSDSCPNARDDSAPWRIS